MRLGRYEREYFFQGDISIALVIFILREEVFSVLKMDNQAILSFKAFVYIGPVVNLYFPQKRPILHQLYCMSKKSCPFLSSEYKRLFKTILGHSDDKK